MKQRGRPRRDAVVIEGNFGKRPEPPEFLTERQKQIWRETAEGEPLDYFGTGALRNMLADYCAHRESLESICEIINSFKAEWLKNSEGSRRYYSLLKMRDLEMRAAASLATKLRLTNQSRYRPNVAATASSNVLRGRKPWEDET
jgi:hypothetical protein